VRYRQLTSDDAHGDKIDTDLSMMGSALSELRLKFLAANTSASCRAVCVVTTMNLMYLFSPHTSDDRERAFRTSKPPPRECRRPTA
jgi:hypothetical protein